MMDNIPRENRVLWVSSDALLFRDICDRFFFFSSRRRHTRLQGDWSSDVCSSDLMPNASRYRMNCSDHCSCWSPPIVPKVIHGLPRRNASEGVSVVRGRLPGATTLG